ncbi:MAG: hypothetical protein ACJ0G4_00685 [Alphaproteobacteria bacterium]|jgi:hypothetical protein
MKKLLLSCIANIFEEKKKPRTKIRKLKGLSIDLDRCVLKSLFLMKRSKLFKKKFLIKFFKKITENKTDAEINNLDKLISKILVSNSPLKVEIISV